MKRRLVFSSRHAATAAVLCLNLASAQAWAGTALEERIIRTPMPHTGLAAGARVQVHYARLHVGVPGTDLVREWQAQADSIRTTVLECVEARRRSGLPASPPREFPQFDTGMHKDTYVTANRQITYRRYSGVSQKNDCTLEEIERSTATLESRAGRCEIDLIARKAKGVCDPVLHAAAPVPPEDPATLKMEREIAAMRSDVTTAAAMAWFENPEAGSGRGGRKRVLGIDCEVMHASDIGMCNAVGGAFRPYNPLTLELTGAGRLLGTAVEARLDAMVGADIFAPHAAGGFQVDSPPEGGDAN